MIYKSYLQSHVQGTTYLTFHITHRESSYIRLLWSAAQDQLLYPPSVLSRGLIVRGKTAPKVRGNLCRRPTPVRQCACPTACILNIEQHSPVWEQQLLTSNTYQSGTHNPVRSIHQYLKMLHRGHFTIYTVNSQHLKHVCFLWNLRPNSISHEVPHTSSPGGNPRRSAPIRGLPRGAWLSDVIHWPTRNHDNTSAHDIYTSNIIIGCKSIIPSDTMIQNPYLLHIIYKY